MKLKLIPVAMAATLVVAGTAFAQTAAAPAPAPAPDPLSFNIALTTNYKFRGQDQVQTRTNQFKPALQGGFDYAFSNGFYIGNWNSTVDFRDPVENKRAGLEIDLYGGYKWNIGEFGLDVGALQYYYPGATKANTTEVYLGASYGPFTAKYSNTVSRGYFGTGYLTNDGRGTQYFNVGFSKEVVPNWTLKASLGQTTYRNAVKAAGVPNYTDYSIGASYDFGSGLSLAGYVQGASNKNSYSYPAPNGTKSINRDTLLFTLTKTL